MTAMTWRFKSLLISLAANALFLLAAWSWFVWPLVPGLYPALSVCQVFDPGNQPYLAACSGWHSTVADTAGVVANIALDWGIIWIIGALKIRKQHDNI
ncbi:MAG: hypothetical protein WAQ52_20075 [Terriglobales bacterium]